MNPAAKRRWSAVGGLAAVGAVLLVLGGAPVVNNALSVWFVDDDPARVAYERFQDLFGNDEVVIVAAGTPGTTLASSDRDRLSDAAERMRAVDGVASVTGPDDAQAGPMARLLMNDEGSVALLVARFEVMDDADARRHDILTDLREATGPLEAAGTELHWAGIGLVYDELNEASFRETPLLTGLSFVVVGLVLFLVTRSAAAVGLALASVLVSIMILMGVFALAGFELNMVTAVLPTLLLVVGTATAVHIFTRVQSAGAGDQERALREVFRPCLFTALTTAAGFASLMAARMAVIRDLGGFAALGVLVSLVTSFAFAGAALSSGWITPRTRGHGLVHRLLKPVATGVTRHPGTVLAVSAVVAALSAWGATRVVVDTYSIEFFREGHHVRVDSDAVETNYGWYLPLEFAVSRSDGGAILDPEVVGFVGAWQEEVERRGAAAWSLSAVDFLDAVPADQNGGLDAAGLAAAGLAAAGLVDEAGAALRVTFGVPMASARGWQERIATVEGLTPAEPAPGVEITPGGYLPLYVRMMEYIVDTQVRSFALALLLVFGIMGIFLRSVRTVVLAVFPNLLPIAMVFGVMGALGIRLDIATVTVAAIALGVVVDDTVHLLFHYRRELEGGADSASAVGSALMEVGPALMGSTLILSCSFAVLGFATVLSISLFGLLSAGTLVFALLSDLLVLPALLVVTGPSSRTKPGTIE